jgi:hypothetical protein
MHVYGSCMSSRLIFRDNFFSFGQPEQDDLVVKRLSSKEKKWNSMRLTRRKSFMVLDSQEVVKESRTCRINACQLKSLEFLQEFSGMLVSKEISSWCGWPKGWLLVNRRTNTKKRFLCHSRPTASRLWKGSYMHASCVTDPKERHWRVGQDAANFLFISVLLLGVGNWPRARQFQLKGQRTGLLCTSRLWFTSYPTFFFSLSVDRQ